MATTARIGNRKTWTVNVGAYNGGTHDHSKLFNRDADDQHPMGAIKGLETFAENTNAHMASKENPHEVTADQVGARPDTWMPTAAQVGARPDTWMPTAAQVGAAPAGYGLGTTATDISNQNLITATAGKSGFFRGNNVTHAPDSDWWRYFVNAGTSNSVAFATHYDGRCYYAPIDNNATSVTWNKIQVHSSNEWANPPLTLGVVYRTTERWNGKVVYAKMVDFGLLPNSTSKAMYVDDGITDFVRVDGDIEGTLVSLATAPFIKEISIINGNSLQIITNTDVSTMYTSPVVYYCKG